MIGQSYEEKLMMCFTKFDFPDIIGFAKILKVDNEIIKKAVLSSAAVESPNLEDLICTTVEVFSQKTRKERREILKLAKIIAAENEKIKEEQKASDITK